jgi:hypothetical protein
MTHLQATYARDACPIGTSYATVKDVNGDQADHVPTSAAESGPKKLTLADLMFKAPAEVPAKICPPPGLEFLEFDGKDEAKTMLADEVSDPESDGRSTRSGTEYRASEEESSGLSDGESAQKQSLDLSALVFSDVSMLKANSPMFVPMLNPETAATLPSFTPEVVQRTPLTKVVQRTPLRAKLRSKAAAYVPTEPTDVTGQFESEAGWGQDWQQWHTEESYNYYDPYGGDEEYSEGYYSGYMEGFSEQDGTSTWGSSLGVTADSTRMFAQI